MGKTTRNPKKLARARLPQQPVERLEYTEDQRKDITAGIVKSLTENGLTLGADPGVKTLMSILAGYQKSGERTAISIPIVAGRAEIHGTLPRYVDEQPVVGVRQTKPPPR